MGVGSAFQGPKATQAILSAVTASTKYCTRAAKEDENIAIAKTPANVKYQQRLVYDLEKWTAILLEIQRHTSLWKMLERLYSINPIHHLLQDPRTEK